MKVVVGKKLLAILLRILIERKSDTYAKKKKNNEDYLIHYGVKGMKWGIRKSKREARKDAKEFARAKMFYGEGAGTRRKLIKAKVNQRSKDNKVYKKEFDKALSEQDMGKHASKAKSERRRKDVSNSVKKTGRGVVNIVTGHPERVGATLAVAAGAYGMAHKYGVDKIVAKNAKQKVSDISNTIKIKRGARKIAKQWGL